MQPIIFTDLDGTLLDDNFSFKKALPALKLVKKRRIPLIFCTSKTEPETRIYLKKTKVNYPFVVENGGAVFIPKDYFKFKFNYHKIKNNYLVIELGISFKKLKNAFNKIKKQFKTEIIGFPEMDAKSIAKDTGLNLKEAELAKKRAYSLPFKIIKKINIKKLIRLIKQYKMNYTKGTNYYYLMGRNDKAKAVKILAKLYRKKYRKVLTIGLGNDFNDLPMLKAVDKAFLIKNKKGFDKDLVKIKNIQKINFNSSKGWNKASTEFLR